MMLIKRAPLKGFEPFGMPIVYGSGTAHGGFKARESRIKAQTSLDIRFYPDAT